MHELDALRGDDHRERPELDPGVARTGISYRLEPHVIGVDAVFLAIHLEEERQSIGLGLGRAGLDEKFLCIRRHLEYRPGAELLILEDTHSFMLRGIRGRLWREVIGWGRCGVMMEGVPTVLLILPSATYRAPEFLEAAAELGVTVVAASNAPSALAPIMGERYLELDLDDPAAAAEAIVELRPAHAARRRRRCRRSGAAHRGACERATGPPSQPACGDRRDEEQGDLRDAARQRRGPPAAIRGCSSGAARRGRRRSSPPLDESATPSSSSRPIRPRAEASFAPTTTKRRVPRERESTPC